MLSVATDLWASQALALDIHLSVAELVQMLQQYRDSHDSAKLALARDVEARLASVGVTAMSSGVVVQSSLPSGKYSTGIDCSSVPGNVPYPRSVSTGQLNWSVFLNGQQTRLNLRAGGGRIGFDAVLGGDARVSGPATIEYYVRLSPLGFIPLGAKCERAATDSITLNANGQFNATLGADFDIALEQRNGKYFVVVGRNSEPSWAPLRAAVDAHIDVRVHDSVLGPVYAALATHRARDMTAETLARLNTRVSEANAKMRAEVAKAGHLFEYELDAFDPEVFAVVLQVLGSPAFHGYLEQNGAEIAFRILANDQQGLKSMLAAGAVCEAIRPMFADMRLPSLYARVGSSCQAADVFGSDLASYFTDSACTQAIAFRPRPASEYCREMIAVGGNTVLGNAASWTPDVNQVGNPTPSVPSRRWTLSQGSMLAASAYPIDGKTLPFMKQVRFREIEVGKQPLAADVKPHYLRCDAPERAPWALSTSCASGGEGQDFGCTELRCGYTEEPVGPLLGYFKSTADASTRPMYVICPVVATEYGDGRDCQCSGYYPNMTCAQQPLLTASNRYPAGESYPRWQGSDGTLAFAGNFVSSTAPVQQPIHCSLEMRVYKKDVAARGLRPLLAIHGGAWKYRGFGFAGLEAQIAHYTEAGFVVFAPFYRLSSDSDGNAECQNASWEQIVSDTDAALTWVNTHARAFGADVGKPMLMGQSAGAHLAAELMVRRPSEIARALLYYAPTDTQAYLAEQKARGYPATESAGLGYLQDLFDVSDIKAVDPANPPQYVLKNSFHSKIVPDSTPPAFLIHGGSDKVVPVSQSLRMCQAYGAATLQRDDVLSSAHQCGVRGSELHLIKQADHALDLCLEGELVDVCPGGDGASQAAIIQASERSLAWLTAPTVGTNRPPTAAAGSDRAIVVGSTASLLGVGTDPDGDALTFSWRQVSGPAVALRSGASAAQATFVAPASSGVQLIFELVVTDARGLTASDQVVATTRAASPPPRPTPPCPRCNIP